MTRDAYEHYRGKKVEFTVQDVYLPDPIAVLSALHENDPLEGVVVDLSDDARDDESAFVVVDVPGLKEPCIVAADRVKLTPTGGTDPS